MLDWSVSFSFSLSETVMVNRAPWYKQLKSIIPTNIPNQKARPRIKKMSINYKSQKKDFAFFHCPPPKKRQVPEKRLCIFSLFPPKKRQVPGKKLALFFVFSPKKRQVPEKRLALFFVFFLKKDKSQKKLTQFRSSEQSILHSSSFSFFFFFFFFFLQIEAPKAW